MTTLYYKKTCSRCPREDDIAITLEEALARTKVTTKPVPKLKVEMDGQTVVDFTELCATCEELVSRAVMALADKAAKASSTRTRSEKAAPSKAKAKAAP